MLLENNSLTTSLNSQQKFLLQDSWTALKLNLLKLCKISAEKLKFYI